MSTERSVPEEAEGILSTHKDDRAILEDEELDRIEAKLLGYEFSLAINQKALDAIRYLRNELEDAHKRRIVYSPDAKAMSDRVKQAEAERDNWKRAAHALAATPANPAPYPGESEADYNERCDAFVLVHRARARPNDAPMETERLIDDMAEWIEGEAQKAARMMRFMRGG